jgi:hypothetical protein
MLFSKNKEKMKEEIVKLQEALKGSIENFEENIFRSYFDFYSLKKRFPQVEGKYETVKKKLDKLSIMEGKSYKSKQKVIELQKEKGRLETILNQFQTIDNRIQGAKATLKLLKEIVKDDKKSEEVIKTYEEHESKKRKKRK